jgi:two-component system, OmpR family, response regulator
MAIHPSRVLVVDDEPSICHLLRMILESEGYEVVTAESAAAAISALDSFSPDIALLDVMLPDMLGFDLVPILRATDGDVPVIFVTARDLPADRLRGLTIGDDYIAKPFSLEELLARVRIGVRRGGRLERPSPV